MIDLVAAPADAGAAVVLATHDPEADDRRHDQVDLRDDVVVETPTTAPRTPDGLTA